ncbi:MAG TPA: alpha/beta fold hydrolase, partial [Kofleriaceae bacterium]|nr:alpha/beta fold hydrolase [Kofleriaceae bacterium]
MTSFQHEQRRIRDHEIHVVTSGNPGGTPYVLLHGWPESWSSWHDVMAAAGDDARCIAIDLPGIGESHGAVASGAKRAIAEIVHELLGELGLGRDTTLVGHDAGGMVAYAYLRAFDDVARVVIVNTVIPGVAPWDEVIRRPDIFHFAFHQVPHLP